MCYLIQDVFEGTQAQPDSPVDLAATLLGMKKLENGRYVCTLLRGFSTLEFYHCQVSGFLWLLNDANKNEKSRYREKRLTILRPSKLHGFTRQKSSKIGS